MKSKDVIIDSDVIISFLQGREDISEKLNRILDKHNLFVTPVSVSEIIAGVRENEEELIDHLFEVIKVLEINRDIGKLAGSFIQRFAGRKNIEMSSAFIAASVVHFDFILWTANISKYPMLDKKRFL